MTNRKERQRGGEREREKFLTSLRKEKHRFARNDSHYNAIISIKYPSNNGKIINEISRPVFTRLYKSTEINDR